MIAFVISTIFVINNTIVIIVIMMAVTNFFVDIISIIAY